ncbi:MAG: cytochrome c oxidase subunit II [Acidobacteria bacterium]|nr:cytochrome c oxidase subunit II [Acidobacteriota bacterium]
MENRQSGGASFLGPALFAVVLLGLIGSTVYIFARRIWWFPEPVTALGASIDRQFDYTLIITGIVFVLAQLGLAYTILRYRDRGGRAHYSHGHTGLEVIWIALTAILFVGLGIAAEAAWRDYHSLGPAAEGMPVEIWGKQFKWYFRYPGPDGQFGRTAPELVNDLAGNYMGVDFDDPAAKDDIITATLAVPVNQRVNVTLRTLDVTHSFFVRELRFKQDAVPGLLIRMNFTAEKAGTYEVVCAELCGLGHHQMRADLMVVPPDDFEKWLGEQAAYMAALTGAEPEPESE